MFACKHNVCIYVCGYAVMIGRKVLSTHVNISVCAHGHIYSMKVSLYVYMSITSCAPTLHMCVYVDV